MLGGCRHHRVGAAHGPDQAVERLLDDQLHADRRGQVEAGVGARHELVHHPGVVRRCGHQPRPPVGEQRLHVGARAGAEVVQDRHLIAPCRQPVCEVRADEARSSGDQMPQVPLRGRGSREATEGGPAPSWTAPRESRSRARSRGPRAPARCPRANVAGRRGADLHARPRRHCR